MGNDLSFKILSPAGHLQSLRRLDVHGLALVHQGELVELLDVKQRLGNNKVSKVGQEGLLPVDRGVDQRLDL